MKKRIISVHIDENDNLRVYLECIVIHEDEQFKKNETVGIKKDDLETALKVSQRMHDLCRLFWTE